MEMKNKRILVAGANGMIGSAMVRRLHDLGNTVIGVDYQDYGLNNGLVWFINADLRRSSDIDYIVRLVGSVDCIIDLAADMGGMGFLDKSLPNGAQVISNNCRINLNILQLYNDLNAKMLFFSSSACVYPEFLEMTTDAAALKESDAIPAQPDLYYGWEKLMMEKMLEAHAKDRGYNVRIARYHNVYGAGYIHSDVREKAPMALCKKALLAPDGGNLEVWGDGQATRSFMYIDDCLDGTIKLIESDYNKPLNIGSSELVTIDQLAQFVIDVSGKNLKIVHDTTKPEGVRGRNSDNTLVKRVLNWEPNMYLHDGIKLTYDWLARNYKSTF